MRILDCLKTFETTIWCFKQNSLNSMIKVNPLELQYVRGQWGYSGISETGWISLYAVIGAMDRSLGH